MKSAKLGGNICQICARDIRDCPWLMEEIPVPGWTAKPIRKNAKNGWTESFQIGEKDCPLYIPPRRGRKL